MKKFLTPFVLLLVGLMFSSGCTNVGAIIVTGLRLELTGIERAADGTVAVSWRILNPNVTSYLLSQVDQKIYLNGTLVGTTRDKEPIAVPAQNRAGKTTHLRVADGAAERLLAEAAAQGTAVYRVETTLKIQLYGDMNEEGDLIDSGSVKVTSK